MPSHRTGLLVIRAWLEDGSTEPLRAHVRVTGDISTGNARTLTISEPEAVVEVVEKWLQTIRNAGD